jgi:ribosomal protein L40E
MDDNTTAPQTRRCPTCGADMPQDARFCGACGTESLPTETSGALAASETASEVPASAEQTPAAAPSAPSAPSMPLLPTAATSAATAPAAPITGDRRICTWCGASNPRDAASCVACGAVFPTPEGDEALERAARARIQSREADIKPVKAGWWPFRSRGA